MTTQNNELNAFAPSLDVVDDSTSFNDIFAELQAEGLALEYTPPKRGKPATGKASAVLDAVPFELDTVIEVACDSLMRIAQFAHDNMVKMELGKQDKHSKTPQSRVEFVCLLQRDGKNSRFPVIGYVKHGNSVQVSLSYPAGAVASAVVEFATSAFRTEQTFTDKGEYKKTTREQALDAYGTTHLIASEKTLIRFQDFMDGNCLAAALAQHKRGITIDERSDMRAEAIKQLASIESEIVPDAENPAVKWANMTRKLFAGYIRYEVARKLQTLKSSQR